MSSNMQKNDQRDIKLFINFKLQLVSHRISHPHVLEAERHFSDEEYFCVIPILRAYSSS